MRIEQTLHGYEEGGHQLLAASTALPDALGWTLDRCSDLSGYLAPGEDFERFHTGYPCGPYTVYARTWHDRQAPREGSVFTHSLLLDPADAAAVEDPAALWPLLRRPERGALESYRAPLDWRPAPVAPPALSPDARMRLMASLFLMPGRPLLWMEPSSAEDVARMLWIAMPPWLRPDWTFCTRALHPRYEREQPFLWMAPGPHARSAFGAIRAVLVEPRLPPKVDARARKLRMAALDPAALQARWRQSPADLRSPHFGLIGERGRAHAEKDWSAALRRLAVAGASGLEDTTIYDAEVDLALAHLTHRAPRGRRISELSALLAQGVVARAPRRVPALQRLVGETLIALAPGLLEADLADLQILVSATRRTALEPTVDGALVRAPHAVRRRLR